MTSRKNTPSFLVAQLKAIRNQRERWERRKEHAEKEIRLLDAERERVIDKLGYVPHGL